jgi:superfamily I DNA and RNA helicase
MASLVSELQAVRDNSYQLRFQVPTPAELANMRKIHRDMSEAEIKKRNTAVEGAEKLLTLMESGELPPEALPEELLRRLAAAVKKDG